GHTRLHEKIDETRFVAVRDRLAFQAKSERRSIAVLMIQLNSAGKRYGHKLLFAGADLLITTQDRVGLVGADGTGKTTFLKILAGLETLDYGNASLAKGIDIGYLPQDGLALSGRTVFAECMSVFSRLQGMEKELEQLMSRMAEVDHTSAEYEQI